jgi:glutamate dehydrogenase
MTETVSQLVLADNIAQSLCLSLEERRISDNRTDNLAVFFQVADRLESAGYLDRSVESFATTKEIKARPGQLISRPELADLMAASKMYLSQQLQNQTTILSEELYDRYLDIYFPSQLSVRFKQHLADHPLANEIKATIISNKVINQAGCEFLSLSIDNENGCILDTIDCYLAFDQILQADALRKAIGALDNQLPADLQYQLLLQLEQTLVDFCRWFVSNSKTLRPDANTIDCYSHYLSDYESYIIQHNPEHWRNQLDQYQQAQIPTELGQKLAFIANIQNFPFIVLLTTETQQNFSVILDLLNDIAHTLGLNEIQQQLSRMPLRDVWEKKVATDLQEDMQYFSGRLLRKILSSRAKTCGDYFGLQSEKQPIKQYRRLYMEIQNTSPTVLFPYVALVRALGRIENAPID